MEAEILNPRIEKVYIPKVSKERLLELSKKVKALYNFNGKLRHIKPVDIFSIAFTWDPEKGKNVQDGTLVPLAEVKTYHTYAFYGFFKPTIAECLAQIPDEIMDKVVAFEIIKSPGNADEMNAEKEALNAGYHVAVTRYYGKA